MGADMGHSVVAGSWLEGANPLVSTAVGALAFWVLGAVVGLCVRPLMLVSVAAGHLMPGWLPCLE